MQPELIEPVAELGVEPAAEAAAEEAAAEEAEPEPEPEPEPVVVADAKPAKAGLTLRRLLWGVGSRD